MYREFHGLRDEAGALNVPWEEFRFAPRPPEHARLDSGGVRYRSAGVAYAVRVPSGARLRGELLLTAENPRYGFDAAAVWYLAQQGRRGFAMPAQEKTAPCDPSRGRVDMPNRPSLIGAIDKVNGHS